MTRSVPRSLPGSLLNSQHLQRSPRNLRPTAPPRAAPWSGEQDSAPGTGWHRPPSCRCCTEAQVHSPLSPSKFQLPASSTLPQRRRAAAIPAALAHCQGRGGSCRSPRADSTGLPGWPGAGPAGKPTALSWLSGARHWSGPSVRAPAQPSSVHQPVTASFCSCASGPGV